VYIVGTRVTVRHGHELILPADQIPIGGNDQCCDPALPQREENAIDFHVVACANGDKLPTKGSRGPLAGFSMRASLHQLRSSRRVWLKKLTCKLRSRCGAMRC
jgi:hypothetical protein